MGEEQTFLYPQGSSGGYNNQIDMRQIRKRKEPNLICTYLWEPHIQERARDSSCQRGSEIEGEHGYIRHSEGGMR